MNVVVLIGRLVADPELKYTPSGVAVCSFRIAVDRRFKSESGEREADFIDIVAWRQQAEFVANYMSKGRLVGIQGRMQTRSWIQQDGQRRWKTEVVADQVQFLDKPKDAQAHDAEPISEPEPGMAAPLVPNSDIDMDYDPFAEE
ncbi:MAG: single-stranded DNA-binding protein [Armatimonadetes bacterium]|nr:single-stranded DNA-binding protein [Armatimonadota bacterium]